MGVNIFFSITNLINRRILINIKAWFHLHVIKKTKKKENVDLDWRLGIERPFFFSPKFSINGSPISISGSQITHNSSLPIKYSIVKLEKFGTSIQYFESVTYYGNFSEGELHHTFHLPCGTGYQLMVFNYFNYHSTGKLKILQK